MFKKTILNGDGRLGNDGATMMDASFPKTPSQNGNATNHNIYCTCFKKKY